MHRVRVGEPSDNSHHDHASTLPECLLCGEVMRLWLTVPVIDTGDREMERFNLYWCDTSQYGMIHPRPSPARVARYYEGTSYYTHHSHNSAIESVERPSFLTRSRMHLAWRLDQGCSCTADRIQSLLERHPSSILDVGCGNGALLADLKERGHSVNGIEPDPCARRVAIQNGLEVTEGTAEEIPQSLHDLQFDAIILNHVLEHCLDPVQAVCNLARLLSERGLLVIEVPNNECLGLQVSQITWNWLDVPRHLNFFSTKSLIQCCESVGLRILATEYAGFCRQFSASWLRAEQRTWDSLARAGYASRLPPRYSSLRSWMRLLRAAVLRSRFKYDSVRIIAEKVS